MRLVNKELVEKWNDGSIKKRGKGELIRKFHRQLGYSDQSNLFGEIIGGKVSPTPDQHALIKLLIEEYWSFYNHQPEAAQ